MRNSIPLAALLALVLCTLSCQNKSVKTESPTKTESAEVKDDSFDKPDPAIIGNGKEPGKEGTHDPSKEKPPALVKDETEPNKGDSEPSKTEEGSKTPDETSKVEEGVSVKKEPKGNAEPKDPAPVVKEPEVTEPEIVEPEPLEMPKEDSEAWDQLRDSTDFSTVLDLLYAKWKATEAIDRKIRDSQALVAACISYYYADRSKTKYHDRAEEVFSEIKYRTNVNQQWKRQISALLLLESGEPEDAENAAQDIRDAYLSALESVPLKAIRIYHALRTRDKDGFFKERMLSSEKRPNEVYTLRDDIHVAIKFKFLKGIRDDADDLWNYNITASAQLFEKDPEAPNHHLGRKVVAFRPRPQVQRFSDPHSPDKVNNIRLPYRLPVDLKTNQDYVLVVTIGDGNRPAQKETVYLTLKIRPNRAD